MSTENIRNGENSAESKSSTDKGKANGGNRITAPSDLRSEAKSDVTDRAPGNRDQREAGAKQQPASPPVLPKVNLEDNSPEKSVSGQSESDDRPFDFGGLPDRDLKKNLGCGG